MVMVMENMMVISIAAFFAMIANIYLHGSGTALRTLSSHLESRCDKENSLCLHEAPCLAAETGPI